METIKPSNRMWRALVRVVGINDECVTIVVPGWDWRQEVSVSIEDIPIAIREVLAIGKYLHVKVNVGADNRDELVFCDWETS